jgi:RNA polymerase sigma-70 factor (ECF subfamily)
MNLIRTFQSIPAGYGIEGPPQRKTQQLQETLAPRPEVARLVVDEANQLPVGEEWEQIQRGLAGDCDALSTLFARHRERLYGAAFSLLRNKEDAEDALQDGLLSAYVNLRSFEGRARFSTWLTRIVFNAAFMKRRRLRAHPQQPLDEPIVNDGPAGTALAIDETPDPEQLLARVETRAVLKKVISQLPPLLRSALHLRYVRDLSIREAARVESVRIGAIKSRSFRARKQLASLVDARDVIP